ncbi:TetR/AcrR family transcriptional regulator [Chitinimonas sp. PSY-7]|uniref:TetR family transcriptional regulator n=1 Tax=Chitinimonas sp. PSY-7 TaxID=3459088 RepID=UPI00403FF383
MNHAAQPAIEIDAQTARQAALAALRTLAATVPADTLTYADIAKASNVPWQTVKRLLGPREQFAALLEGAVAEPVDTRDRILESAARVFSQKSYLGASLDEVAADAGLTKGAVYWHFKSKNDLFFALLDSRFQVEFDHHLPEAIEQQSIHVSPREGTKALLAGVLDRVKQDPDWPRLFLEFLGQARDPEVRKRLARSYQESYRLSATLITQQHSLHKQPAPVDPQLQAIFWSALMDGLITAWLLNPEAIDLDTLMPRIVDMLWQGLDPEKQAPQEGDSA